MHRGLTIQAGRPSQPPLMLLFHGVGARPDTMLPLGQVLAARVPAARVICVQAPLRSDIAFGWQWYSIRDISEETRPARVAAAVPRFVSSVRHWQREAGVGPEQTLLVGFSQGATMALQASLGPDRLASRIVSLAGRFAPLPDRLPNGASVHLIHGDRDETIPVNLSIAAADALRALGGAPVLDLFPGIGHVIAPEFIACVADRLDADEGLMGAG